jgi:conjugal transfer pilus assembly protein TraW
MRITGTRRTRLVAALWLSLAGAAGARDLGQVGRVYPIAEPDALGEIESRAARVNWDEVLPPQGRERLVLDYRPAGLEPLPRAQEDRVRLVDLTYTLDVDLPDGKGGVLYPKGYTFNPLEHVVYPNILVFLDGDDPEQVAWFEGSALAREPRVRVILSGGSYHELARTLGRPVFYLTRPLRERLQLEAVPAVAWQQGVHLELREIDVPPSAIPAVETSR